MREIKFRAWDKYTKTMYVPDGVVEGQPFLRVEGGIIKYTGHVLMQYTGLLDRNGKEIYEGDWLVWNQTKYKYPVEMKYGCWKAGSGIIALLKNVEIIGNIWEHPDLLESK